MVNFNQILKQAQSAQNKIQEMESLEYEGKSGGGMVFVKVTGRGKLKSISIDSSIINPEEKELLEDLIIAAYNDAEAKAEEASKDAMSNALGGLNLPPGFKLPF